MTDYAFEGDVIKLNRKDYERWIRVFKHIPNLDAVLLARDYWLSTEAPSDQVQRWFISTSNYLVKVDAHYKQLGEKATLDNNGNEKYKTLP